MKKKYYLVSTNLILLILQSIFVAFRYSKLKELFIKLDEEVFISDILILMKFELIITFLGFLSFLGVIIWDKSKVFFGISMVFISIQLVELIFTASITSMYIVRLIATIVFIWGLIFENGYTVYANRTLLKLGFLFVGFSCYFLYLYYNGVIWR